MIIYLGADHRGFKFKEVIKRFLKEEGYNEVFDLGNASYVESDDYPDFAAAVAEEVGKNPENTRGILLCGSGSGMDIAANKFPGIRATLGFSADQIFDSRRDDDINILSLAADFIREEEAKTFVKVFLSTPFDRAERHRRRIEKIDKLERDARNG